MSSSFLGTQAISSKYKSQRYSALSETFVEHIGKLIPGFKDWPLFSWLIILLNKTEWLLHTRNKQSKKEIAKTIPLTIEAKRIKYFRINWTKIKWLVQICCQDEKPPYRGISKSWTQTSSYSAPKFPFYGINGEVQAATLGFCSFSKNSSSISSEKLHCASQSAC